MDGHQDAVSRHPYKWHRITWSRIESDLLYLECEVHEWFLIGKSRVGRPETWEWEGSEASNETDGVTDSDTETEGTDSD